MLISPENQREIEKIIKNCIRTKLRTYNPETKHMPFHFRLLGHDKMALFSFIHFVNTSIGKSIFEPVAAILAQSQFLEVRREFSVNGFISTEAESEISSILNDLTIAKVRPDMTSEVERIRRVCTTGKMSEVKATQVDLFLRNGDGAIYLFDIKTAKPNKGSFKEFKRQLLQWTAMTLANEPDVDVNASIAIPYNPYFPKGYERWTAVGMLDNDHQIKVADEFWDFLVGGEVFWNS